MRLPIPRAEDLVHAAMAMRDGVGDALGMGPRLLALLADAESLLTRVGAVVDRIEATVDRSDALVELYEEPVRQLAPAVRRFADALDPNEVGAMVGLVDRLPQLLTHLDEDVLPILTTLDRVAPDLHQLLEIGQDLQGALGGVPGLGWLRKRAEKEEEEAEAHAREIQVATLKPSGKPRAGAREKD